MSASMSRVPAHTPSAARVALAFGAVYLIWGSTYLVIKLVSQHGAFVCASARFLVAGLILLGFAWWRGLLRRSDFCARSWLHATIVGSCLMLLGNGGVAIATRSTDSGIVALMTAITPLWLVGLDSMMHRTRAPSKVVWLGIALGIAGIAVLKSETIGATSTVSTVGILIMIVATLGWALGSVWSKRPDGADSPVAATAMQMLCGGAVLAIASVPKEFLFHDEWTLLMQSPPDFATWMQWSYLVVFGSLCGFTAYIWLLRHQPAARVATYAYVNPLVALVLGWGFIGEPIGIRTVYAAALMLSGVAVIQVANARKKSATRVAIAGE